MRGVMVAVVAVEKREADCGLREVDGEEVEVAERRDSLLGLVLWWRELCGDLGELEAEAEEDELLEPSLVLERKTSLVRRTGLPFLPLPSLVGLPGRPSGICSLTPLGRDIEQLRQVSELELVGLRRESWSRLPTWSTSDGPGPRGLIGGVSSGEITAVSFAWSWLYCDFSRFRLSSPDFCSGRGSVRRENECAREMGSLFERCC